MRLWNVIIKELKEFQRDKGFILTIFIVPLVIMTVFGYTFQADIKHLDTIVLDYDNSRFSKEIVKSIEESEYYRVIEYKGTLENAKKMVIDSKARAVVEIPYEFGDRMENAQAGTVKMYLDSSDYAVYNILKGAAGSLAKDSLRNIVSILVEDLEQEKESKQVQVDDIDLIVRGVEQKSQDALDKMDGLKSKINEVGNLTDDAKLKSAKTEKNIQDLEKDIAYLKKESRSAVSSMDSLEKQLVNASSMNSEAAQAIRPIIQKISDIKGRMENLSERVDGLSVSEDVSNPQEYFNINQIGATVSSNEGEATNLNKTANELKEEYNKVQEKLEEVRFELKTLKKDFLSFPLDMDQEYLFGQVSYFQYLAPAIITLILFFIGVVLTTLNIVEERKSDTLFRVSTTPLRKIEFLGGKFLVFLGIGMIETVYVLLLAIYGFGVSVEGSLFSVAIVLFFLMGASIGLGLLISSFVKTMRQATMFLPGIILPSVLISQTFAPIEVMPWYMQKIAHLSPMLYSNIALRGIMTKGLSIYELILPVTILAVYAIVTLFLGVAITKKRIT